MTARIHRDDTEWEDLSATKLLQVSEVKGHALQLVVQGRVWSVLLANGTMHVLVERPDTTFCTSEDCADKPLCPAVVRFMIRRSRQSVGEHSTTIQ